MTEITPIPEYHPMYKRGFRVYMCINRREFFMTIESAKETYELLGKAIEEVKE